MSASVDLSAYPPPDGVPVPPRGPVPRPPDPDRRPGTVTAAAVVAIVLSALVLCCALAVLAAGLSGSELVLDPVRRDARGAYDNRSDADLAGQLVAFGAVLSVWCAAAIGCAVLVLRRSNVARVLLAMSAVVAACYSLARIRSVVPVVPLLAAVVVVVLLFLGGANAWFFPGEDPAEETGRS